MFVSRNADGRAYAWAREPEWLDDLGAWWRGVDRGPGECSLAVGERDVRAELVRRGIRGSELDGLGAGECWEYEEGS
ncbi:MAG: hypothetical protein ACYTAF_07975 [Planctomycetota bacterium]